MRRKQRENAETVEEREQGLLHNCVDSIEHALAHFDAEEDEGSGFHNRKWAILSVAHAVEAYCNRLLLMLDSEHPRTGRFPTLEDAVSRVRGSRSPDISTGEHLAVRRVFPKLHRLRDQLMHRVPPTELEIKQTATALLVLLHLLRCRTDLRTKHLLDRSPSIEQVLVGHFWSAPDHEWFKIAEELVLERYEEESLNACPNCGHWTLTPDEGCRACFNERGQL